MNHRIYVDLSKEDMSNACIEAGFSPLTCDVSSRVSIKGHVEKFVLYSFPNEVLTVDTGAFLVEDFFVFLKVLESVSMRGKIWFHNSHLSEYPWTVRSRCEVVVGSSRKMDRWEYQLGKLNLDEKLKGRFKYLTHYSFAIAEKLILIRDPLRDFLVQLDSAGKTDFYTLTLRIKEFDQSHVLLFREWLDGNEFFSKRELGMCSFLRTDHFRKIMDSFLFFDQTSRFDPTKFFFPFVVLYKMVRG